MLPGIMVSTTDLDRIESVLDALPDSFSDIKEKLFTELGRAEFIKPVQVPPTLVTMNSRVRFTIITTGVSMIKTLVYPNDHHNYDETISILTPLGSALLGLSVGQEIEWEIDPQKTLQVRIDDIEYQPERSGDFHL